MTVLMVEPGKAPFEHEMDTGLAALQQAVGGRIEAVYPYDDPVVFICNEEGKLDGLPLNRALRGEDGEIYDAVAGTFFICGLGEESFDSLSPELMEKYKQKFWQPEGFAMVNGKIVVVPYSPEKQTQAPVKSPPAKHRGEAR